MLSVFRTAVAVAIVMACLARVSEQKGKRNSKISSQKPDIILIVADDMGWNDVSFHGSDQVLTPNIDALAYEGTILHQYYTHPICTPTRAALLTGHYASSTGMQGRPLSNSQDRALPRRFRLLPAHLRDLGYRTHLVGKWHLGAVRPGDLPTAKGFDSHFGYRGGFIDYFEYDLEEELEGRIVSGFDLFRNTTVAKDVYGYSTDIFTDEAVSIIQKAGKDPLFLMVSYNAPHAGNDQALLQAPAGAVRRERRVRSSARRLYAAATRALDAGVGALLAALRRADRLQHSIVVFAGDNGAPTEGEHANWGSNWPLRGLKMSAWEGGIRVPALIWSPSLPAQRRYDYLFHVADWLPTFYSAAGGDASTLDVEGVSQWEALRGDDEDPPRTSSLLDADDEERAAAYREGNLKIVLGQYSGGTRDGYFGESGALDALGAEGYASEVASSVAARVLSGGRSHYSSLYAAGSLQRKRDALRVQCDDSVAQAPATFGNCSSGCLFDIFVDPCETKDLSEERPAETRTLRDRLEGLLALSVPSLPRFKDPRADPALHGGVWMPWLNDDQ